MHTIPTYLTTHTTTLSTQTQPTLAEQTNTTTNTPHLGNKRTPPQTTNKRTNKRTKIGQNPTKPVNT